MVREEDEADELQDGTGELQNGTGDVGHGNRASKSMVDNSGISKKWC